jgi:hypothetical protein
MLTRWWMLSVVYISRRRWMSDTRNFADRSRVAMGQLKRSEKVGRLVALLCVAVRGM